MAKRRFTVVEYVGHYSVRDNETMQERVMGDGVDTLHTPNGKAMRPGSEYFRRIWERDLNRDANQTAEAYFNH